MKQPTTEILSGSQSFCLQFEEIIQSHPSPEAVLPHKPTPVVVWQWSQWPELRSNWKECFQSPNAPGWRFYQVGEIYRTISNPESENIQKESVTMAIWVSIGFEYENIAYHEWIEVVSDPFFKLQIHWPRKITEFSGGSPSLMFQLRTNTTRDE